MKRALMILAVLAMAFAGCHKDNENGGNSGDNNPTMTTYTVTFNANGGTGSMQPQAFFDGEAQRLAVNTFTWDNHEFIGWNTAADGSGEAYQDAQEMVMSQNVTLYAQWMAYTGSNNGHNYVDLGLPSGKLWATCNVGASSPTDYGDYFAWGETTPKATYNWSTYKYANGDYNKLTKYCNNSRYGNNGFTDTLTVLLPEDDAATANWGAGWRMPTNAEMQELYNNTTVTWTTQNGVNGRLFTASNGNSLFLPAAGNRNDDELGNAGSDGDYWSSSLDAYSISPYYAHFFYFYSEYCGLYYYDYRYYGFTVRPVCPAQN